MKRIDLNCDMGEIPEAIADGTQEALLPSFTSVNIACGGHAGDDHTMRATIEQALRSGVAIGAHPGYPDRQNFGRLQMPLSGEELEQSVYRQVLRLAEIAAECGTRVRHVKPHGALYNQAVHDRNRAQAIARGVARWSSDVVLVGLADSPMLDVFRECGFRVAAEAFADRRYQPDGTLRSRKLPGALIVDPREAARQAVDIVLSGRVTAGDRGEVRVQAQTICVHGDTPGAPAIAAAVARALGDAGVIVGALGREAG